MPSTASVRGPFPPLITAVSAGNTARRVTPAGAQYRGAVPTPDAVSVVCFSQPGKLASRPASEDGLSSRNGDGALTRVPFGHRWVDGDFGSMQASSTNARL